MSMRVALITLGDPERLTGGYLYHRRVAELAPKFDASMEFVSAPNGVLRAVADARRTLKRAAGLGDAIVCDSIVAAPLTSPKIRPASARPRRVSANGSSDGRERAVATSLP
jgi:hypothetical protein